jgi:hypothetical protein
MNKKLIGEVVGWYGTIAILCAYFLVSFSIISVTDFWYQFLNITGALGIGILSYIKKAYQPMVLNIVWTVIGLAVLVQVFLLN